MMILGLRKLGNICCGHKMFLNKIRNIFCVPDTKFVSATNVARAGKRGNICVGNNVSSFARALTALRRVRKLKALWSKSPYWLPQTSLNDRAVKRDYEITYILIKFSEIVSMCTLPVRWYQMLLHSGGFQVVRCHCILWQALFWHSPVKNMENKCWNTWVLRSDLEVHWNMYNALVSRNEWATFLP